MSMISEQVKELRDCVYRWQNFESVSSSEPYKLLNEAADTIEALSAKLAKENMEQSERYYNGGWTPCKERFPDEIGKYIIHVITGTGEDYVGMWLYERGHHLSGRQYWIDDKEGYWASPYNGDPINEGLSKNVIAWQPLPKPYEEKQ